MSAKLFSPETCAAVIARLEVGMNLPQAAEGAGIKPATARGWVAKGRRDGEGAYFEFASAVVRAQDQPTIEPMTEEEHRAKVSEVARNGNVQALKLYWEMIRADSNPDEIEEEQEAPLTGVDELSQRRARA